MGNEIPWSVRVKKGGKADYVKWDHPEHGVIDLCVCDYNTDFSDGCIAHVLEKDLASVIANGGKYPDPQEIREREGHISFGCLYCYAWRKNTRGIAARSVTQTTREDIEHLVASEDEKNWIVRLGKNTEVGHPYYRKTLIDFLELTQEYGVRVIMPTKMLEFDKKVASLLKGMRSALNYSIVMDGVEMGPESQGFTQPWRIEQSLRYRDAGVRSSITLTCDESASIEWNQRLGYIPKETIEAHEKEGIPLRLLPMRIPSRKLAPKLTGRSWDDLLSDNHKLDFAQVDGNGVHFTNGSYARKAGGFLEVQVLHPDFRELHARFDGKNIGACGKAGGFEHCDKCGLTNGNGSVPRYRFPIEQLAPPPTRTKPSRAVKKPSRAQGLLPIVYD